jgi:hypothetical protein
MTIAPKAPWLMKAVMKNIELRGSTMGSRQEFKDMVDFIEQHKLTPIVSRVVSGIDNADAIEELFEEMKRGTQFGKLVIKIATSKVMRPFIHVYTSAKVISREHEKISLTYSIFSRRSSPAISWKDRRGNGAVCRHRYYGGSNTTDPGISCGKLTSN